MTEEVAELVLADNRNQARALTLDGLRSVSRYEEFVAFTEDLIAAGVLSRADDADPDPRTSCWPARTASGACRGRSWPSSSATPRCTPSRWSCRPRSRRARPDGPFLVEYFPQRLQREFADHFDEHPLRREIVATAAVNHVVNCAGVTFLSRMMAGGKFGIGEVIAAYSEVDRSSGALSLRERLQDVPPEAAYQGLLELEEALESATRDALEGKSRATRPWSRCGPAG